MGNAIVSFVIGLSIILGSSILNAAGLNLSKLDHLRNARSGLPEWKRPLLILGMFLYCISQLIGSTLALEYMRAEYVAPLGSTSLIFNFLFASFLVGTQITSNDIWGTVVIIVGVCGIVGFGSWNSGIDDEMDVDKLTHLWRRGAWLAYFFAMAITLIFLFIVSNILDGILFSRDQLPVHHEAVPRKVNSLPSSRFLAFFVRVKRTWDAFILWLTDRLEVWTSSRSNKQLAWTLGILWAATGGDLAGGTLVFAKAWIKLLSGSLSHTNSGNQFGQASSVFTILLTVVTAITQIICLNRALRVYDSTLVVPVFYSIYTGTGWLNSLIFNEEVDSYHGYVLFLIVLSMAILISGVVLLTLKKPDNVTPESGSGTSQLRSKPDTRAMSSPEEMASGSGDGEQEVLWTLGDSSDDEDNPRSTRHPRQVIVDEDEDTGHDLNPIQTHHVPDGLTRDNRRASGEAQRLIDDDDDDDPETSPIASLFEVPLNR